MSSTQNAALPIMHLLSSGGFYGAERMLLDHCLATPGQHQVQQRIVFLGLKDLNVSIDFQHSQLSCHRAAAANDYNDIGQERPELARHDGDQQWTEQL